jgi:hypothetical protein
MRKVLLIVGIIGWCSIAYCLFTARIAKTTPVEVAVMAILESGKSSAPFSVAQESIIIEGRKRGDAAFWEGEHDHYRTVGILVSALAVTATVCLLSSTNRKKEA